MPSGNRLIVPSHNNWKLPACARLAKGLRKRAERGKQSHHGTGDPMFAHEETRETAACHPPTTPCTVLIVEDHPALRTMMMTVLIHHGYHVRTAPDGEAALAILAIEAVHLLLLDLMLPGIDGFEVLRWLRREKSRRAPYIIVLSATLREEVTHKVRALGGDECLAKPFCMPDLLARIQAVGDCAWRARLPAPAPL
jgi:CheY-like chemotaxis protein